MSHRMCQVPECRAAVFARGFCPEHHATHCVSGLQSAADRKREGHEDMVLLESLSNDSIVSNLRRRHKADLIYTYIGDVLVSVNPFKRIPIYEPSTVELYSGTHRTELPPHVFATAEAAFRNMLQEEEPQCVIISGESGAGKTEAAKQIMSYIAAVSGGGGGGTGDKVRHVKDVILKSNPLLEALGNAKTLRNNNSSRFGKYFEVKFDDLGAPRGGFITNYLLEKSRVVFQHRGERNFHIFYQLLAGAPKQARGALGLGPPESFAYLSSSGCTTVDGVDDKAEFAAVRASLKAMGMRGREQEEIFRVVAGVLHLGNITFRERRDGGVRVDGAETAAKLLGLDAGALERALTHRRIRTGREEVDALNNALQAGSTRDAVAKGTYDRLFDWVVRRVNSALSDGSDAPLCIAVLDIYGFEVFERNAFEQLCINYVNEKLQQIFIQLTLKSEQEEYKAEGISWKPIKFFNNQVVVDLIEGRSPPGIFLILDDVCATMHAESSGTGAALVGKLGAAHASHPHFAAHRGGFLVRHFAGDVAYDVEDFAEKNKDTMSPDALAVLRASGGRLMQVLYAAAGGGGDDGDGGGAAGAGSRRRPTTAGSKIRKSTQELVRALMASTPHYVRCIKSNDRKRGDTFDATRVLHQVKYLGLLENVRVRRAGFAFRTEFHSFVRRFRLLSPSTWPGEWSGSDRSGCKAILKSVTASGELPLSREEVQLGKTKIFIKSPETLFQLEDLKERRVNGLVARIQRVWRRYRDGKEFVKLRRRAAAYLAPHKERRRESFYRPFHGVYVELDAATREIVTSFGPPAERVVFADEVLKLVHPYPFNYGVALPAVSSPAGDFVSHTVVLTDRALYFIVRQSADAAAAAAAAAAGAVAAASNAADGADRVFLTRRVPLEAVGHVSLSCLADNYMFVHASPGAAERQDTVEWMRDSAAKACLLCARAFTIFNRRHHCRLCGRIFCGVCSSRTQSLPDFDMVDAVRVCDECFGRESCEFLQDQIMVTAKKTELLVLMQAHFRSATGRDLDVRFTDTITYTIKQSMVNSFAMEMVFRRDDRGAAAAGAGDKKRGKKKKPRRQAPPVQARGGDGASSGRGAPALASVAEHLGEGAEAVPQAAGDKRLEVRVASGLPAEFVESRRRAADKRRKEAAARAAADAELRKQREAAREEARRAERKARLAEKKRLKREAAQRAETEEAARQGVRTRPKASRPAAAAAPAAASPAAAACASCGCADYVAHPFKKGTCSNCFHKH